MAGFVLLFAALATAAITPRIEWAETASVVVHEPLRIERALIVGQPAEALNIGTYYDWIEDGVIGPVVPRPLAKPDAPEMLAAPE